MADGRTQFPRNAVESNLSSESGGDGISMLPSRMSASPKRAARRRLFPEPVLPDITLQIYYISFSDIILRCEEKMENTYVSSPIGKSRVTS